MLRLDIQSMLLAQLPAELAHRRLKRRAQRPLFPWESVALANAKTMVAIDDDEQWLRNVRLVELTDRLDMARAMLRRTTLLRLVDTVGAWPSDRFLALGLHWGAAVGAMCHIERTVGSVSIILRPMSPQANWRQRLSAKWAFLAIGRAGGLPPLSSGMGAKARLPSIFDQGHRLVAMIDVPPLGQEVAVGQVAGQPFYMTQGILNFCVEQQIPLVPYAMGLDYETGRRRLEIGEPLPIDAAAATAAMCERLTELWQRDSAQWRLWAALPELIANDV